MKTMVFLPHDVWNKIMSYIEDLVIMDRRDFWIHVVYQRLSKQRRWTGTYYSMRGGIPIHGFLKPSALPRCLDCGFVVCMWGNCICNNPSEKWMQIRGTIANRRFSRRQVELISGKYERLQDSKRIQDFKDLFKKPTEILEESENNEHLEAWWSANALKPAKLQ